MASVTGACRQAGSIPGPGGASPMVSERPRCLRIAPSVHDQVPFDCPRRGHRMVTAGPPTENHRDSRPSRPTQDGVRHRTPATGIQPSVATCGRSQDAWPIPGHGGSHGPARLPAPGRQLGTMHASVAEPARYRGGSGGPGRATQRTHPTCKRNVPVLMSSTPSADRATAPAELKPVARGERGAFVALRSNRPEAGLGAER